MYQSLLCLVALNAENEEVVSKAKALAQTFSARLKLLHVVEYVPLTGTEDAMLTAPISISEELEQRARDQMARLAQHHALTAEQCEVISGDLVTELNSAIEDNQVDLVVVGNHQRKGLSALFDHAEDAVLHRCSCDLIAINLSD